MQEQQFYIWLEKIQLNNKDVYTIWKKELGNNCTIEQIFEGDSPVIAYSYLRMIVTRVNKELFDIQLSMDLDFIREHSFTPKKQLWESIKGKIGIKV